MAFDLTQKNVSGRNQTLRTFVRFSSLSGVGWLLDFTLLLVFVGIVGVSGFEANLVSSLIAAGSVFMLSRRVIFSPKSTYWAWRLVSYLLYTIVIVLVASAALDHLVALLRHEAAMLGLGLPLVALSAIAKTIITPPQLLLNFAVSRMLNERAL